MLSLQAILATALLSSTVFCLPITDHSLGVEERDVFIKCDDGVRIFAVRGSDAAPNNNDIFSFGESLAATIANSQAKDLPYIATFANYVVSEASGVDSLTFRIKRYQSHCPTGKIALFGYSQGAQVVGDTLIGYTGTTGQGLEPEYRDNIVAIVQTADPAFTPGLSIDRGTASTGGVVFRTNAYQYESYGYANRMLSYCDADDMYCASGTSGLVHTEYMGKYYNEIWDFIKSKVE